MASIEDINLDIAELQTLQGQAARKRVQDLLGIEIRKLQTEVSSRKDKEKAAENKASEQAAKPVSVTTSASQTYSTEITTYAWDQSDKFMKIYVTMNGVQEINKDNVKSQFTSRSFRLDVNGLNSKNFFTEVKHLFGDIIVSESYHKVKTDMVLLMLKKSEQKTWAYVTEKEQKMKDKKKPPPPTSSDDPNAGLMDMMKQMYDDGDDEMKRTIAKAWTQSRDKGGSEMPM